MKTLIPALTAVLIGLNSAHAVTPAEQCKHPQSGSWLYGTAAKGCAVEPVQPQEVVLSQFEPAVLVESKISQGERGRYMTDMYAIVKSMGSYYIRRRDPHVSAAEEEAFLRAFFTLASQESLWSHYRRPSDNIVRYMRGDSLHGYGFMQIDDRSHLPNIINGKAQDYIFNMVLGLDIYYAQWVRSANASCINNPGNYKNRARAAWSAYNGGPSQICRWNNPNSPHAQKDRDYKNKYENRPWLAHVADENTAPKLNVKCMAEGVRPCNIDTPVEEPVEYPGVAQKGQTVTISATNGINMRTAIGGSVIHAIPKGTKLKVLEVSINETTGEVHYKVTDRNRTGYVYSGKVRPVNTVPSWTVL